MNTRIASEIVDHTVDLSRVDADMRLHIIGFLQELEEKLVKRLRNTDLTLRAKQRTKALINHVNATINTAYVSISDTQREKLKEIAQLEFNFTRNLINSQIGIDVMAVALTTNQLKRIVDETLIQGAPSKEWWAQQSREYQRRFKNEIRQGMANGESMDEIIRRIRGRATKRHVSGYVVNKAGNIVLKKWTEYKGGITDISTRHAEALVRTSVQTISNQARLDTMLSNDDVVKSIQWVSTLDTRTSDICINLDGKQWTLDYEPIGHGYPFPGPTAHWNCRSTQTPVTKSWDELGIPELAGLEIKKQRASMDGQVSGKITYPEWFAKQSQARQVEILGKTKFKMYKENGLTLSQMVDQRANPLTIGELRDKISSAK